jgi:hypothetical protein
MVVTSSRKKVGATGCGKAARWKSHKTDFPTSLGNPAKTAVAVGMWITPHPPRGSGLEELPHPALALGHDALAA